MCDNEVTSDEYGLANSMISCDFSWASVCGFFHIILTPYLVSELLTFFFFFFFFSVEQIRYSESTVTNE